MNSLVSEHLYAGVFLAALIETVFPPIPTLAIFPLAGYVAAQNQLQAYHLIGLGLAGSGGATIGSLVFYFAARKLGRIALLRYLRYARISEAKLEKVEKWFGRHGEKTVFFGRLLPALREIVSIPAGLLCMKVSKFLLFTFLGSTVYTIGLIFAGYYLGEVAIEFFN